jgi:hypothetical protein
LDEADVGFLCYGELARTDEWMRRDLAGNNRRLARTPCILWSLRCATHRVPALILLKKSIFNLGIDAMELLLRTLGSLLISGDLCFQLGDPIFGGT